MKIKDKIMTHRSESEGIYKKKSATQQTGRHKSLVMQKKQSDFKHFRRIKGKKKSVTLKNQAKGFEKYFFF